MRKQKLSITLNQNVMDQIFWRTIGDEQRSAVIDTALERYLAIIAAAKAKLQRLFDMPERGILMLALQNRTEHINDLTKLPDIVEQRLAAAHMASQHLALRTKLQSLTPTEAACLLDCIELYTAHQSRDHDPGLAKLFSD